MADINANGATRYGIRADNKKCTDSQIMPYNALHIMKLQLLMFRRTRTQRN